MIGSLLQREEAHFLWKGKAVLWLWCLSFLVSGCAQVGVTDLPSHHTGDGFQNPYLEPGKRGFFAYLKMRYFGEEEFADYARTAHKVPTIKPDLQRIHSPAILPRVTWIGHATVLIQHQGIAVLTDPMFSERASPVNFSGPKRATPPAIAPQELPPIDFVVISHSHYDHLDIASVRQLGDRPIWLVPLGLKEWFLRQGISSERVWELDWWDSLEFGKVRMTATPAQHWSARSLWDRNETLWASWLIEIADFTSWYSGDTGYNPYQFKEIGKRFPGIDLALISIGAYAPRWFMKDVHINPEEAVQIHLDIGARRSIAIQWGAFPLTAEPIDEPPQRLQQAVKNENIDPDLFSLMQIGETRIIQ